MLSNEELAVITLKSPFVYEYGNAPHFKQCLNDSPLHFFVRYRSSKDDPSQHRWSRVLQVVDRRVSSTNNNNNDNNNDPSTCTSSVVSPLKWREKYFSIMFRVEGEEKCVELPRLSSKLPTREEVMEYCARAAEAPSQCTELPGNNNNNSGSAAMNININKNNENDGAARSRLPTRAEIVRLAALRRAGIVDPHRGGKGGPSSAPVRLAATCLRNMRLETELGIASSRRATGHTARAMERRGGAEVSLHGGGGNFTQPQSNDGNYYNVNYNHGGSGATRADLTPLSAPGTPTTPTPTMPTASPLLSPDVLELWEQSRQDAEDFYAYVSDEQRSAYIKKISQITLKNYEKNKLDRLRGIANEKRLARKGNLLESGGLWIVDDKLRAQLAQRYEMEQENEGVMPEGGGGDAKKKNWAETSSADDPALGDSGPTLMREEDIMLQRFITKRKSQELSFASVPDEFMMEEEETNNNNNNNNKEEKIHTPVMLSTPMRSPELLRMDGSPRLVTSQLLHRAASNALKRPSMGTQEHTLHAQQSVSVSSAGSEPARKATRRV